jgi:predicted DNA-binding transcriptional regulator YafY
MITLAIAQQMRSPLFMANLDSIRRKIDSSFPPLMKSKVKNLKHRILIAPSASVDVLSGFSTPAKGITERLHQAFLMQQRATIGYKAKNGEVTKRIIEPHFLLLSYPVWYVLAWDDLRNDTRTFRCDRILKIYDVSNEFKLFPISRFKTSMEGIDAI